MRKFRQSIIARHLSHFIVIRFSHTIVDVMKRESFSVRCALRYVNDPNSYLPMHDSKL